jgi:hypothetical protein
VIGTDVPGMFAAGTFYYHGELVFWDVFDTARTVIVSLDHERYKKLIIEVPDVAAHGRAPARRMTAATIRRTTHCHGRSRRALGNVHRP